ncbi:MAG: DNA starvation/stationary phase protection protein [Bryobacteraceae bacterium]|nr:DNA starvation/stationary phase protection protein [Bryobacteraceae bacterium]
MKRTKPDLGLKDSARKAVSGLLGALLADEYLLYTKTRNFHWNVTGGRFHDLHKFFESQYEEIDDSIDEIAERIRSLGEVSPGSLAEFLAATRLKEAPGKLLPADEMIGALLADHESLIRQLRKDIDRCGDEFKDVGNQDFLTGLLEQHEKQAWMLRSFLE